MLKTKETKLNSTHPATFACSLPVEERPCSRLVPFSKEETINPASLGLERPWRRSLFKKKKREEFQSEREEVEVEKKEEKKRKKRKSSSLRFGLDSFCPFLSFR